MISQKNHKKNIQTHLTVLTLKLLPDGVKIVIDKESSQYILFIDTNINKFEKFYPKKRYYCISLIYFTFAIFSKGLDYSLDKDSKVSQINKLVTSVPALNCLTNWGAFSPNISNIFRFFSKAVYKILLFGQVQI